MVIEVKAIDEYVSVICFLFSLSSSSVLPGGFSCA